MFFGLDLVFRGEERRGGEGDLGLFFFGLLWIGLLVLMGFISTKKKGGVEVPRFRIFFFF